MSTIFNVKKTVISPDGDKLQNTLDSILARLSSVEDTLSAANAELEEIV